MNNEAWWRANDRTKYVEDRKIDQLIGLADGILADGIVNQQEAETLKAWLELNGAESNPLMARLLDQVESAPADGVLSLGPARCPDGMDRRGSRRTCHVLTQNGAHPGPYALRRG